MQTRGFDLTGAPGGRTISTILEREVGSQPRVCGLAVQLVSSTLNCFCLSVRLGGFRIQLRLLRVGRGLAAAQYPMLWRVRLDPISSR